MNDKPNGKLSLRWVAGGAIIALVGLLGWNGQTIYARVAACEKELVVQGRETAACAIEMSHINRRLDEILVKLDQIATNQANAVAASP